MGLTIHYEFSHEGDRDDLLEKLSKLRSALAEFPVDVQELFHYEPGELRNESGYGLGPEPGEEEWYYARAACNSLAGSIETERKSLGKVGNVERFRHVRRPGPGEVSEDWEAFVLPVYVTEGCEPFVVTIGRERNSREWFGRGFTKTQYAENFYRAHLLVVSMLDLCDEVGILESVDDEGDYWDTRDLQVLGSEFDGYREIVENLGEQLKSAAEAAGIELEGSAIGGV